MDDLRYEKISDSMSNIFWLACKTIIYIALTLVIGYQAYHWVISTWTGK